MFHCMLLALTFFVSGFAFAQDTSVAESRIGYLEIFSSAAAADDTQTSKNRVLCVCGTDEEGDFFVYARAFEGHVIKEAITPFASRRSCKAHHLLQIRQGFCKVK